MKKKLLFVFLLFVIFIKPIILQYEYTYELEDVINYFNRKNVEVEDFKNIIQFLIGVFNDAYAFYEISAKPPQPLFKGDYHNEVDIYLKLLDLEDKIEKNEIIGVYDIYREILYIMAKLKDCHIQIKWNLLNLDQFFILSPVQFIIKEFEGSPRIFVECLPELFEEDFDMEFSESLNEIEINSIYPIKSINDNNPFDYINNFGEDFLSTKNLHSTFSYKFRNYNDLNLYDIPFKLNDLSQFKIVFDNNEEEIVVNTKYFIGSDIDINEEDNLRNLNYKNNINNNREEKNIKHKKRKRKLGEIFWDYKYESEDSFNCFEDDVNKINIYYISTFNAKYKERFLETIKNCYSLFDNNTYPIVVINDLNDGGLVSLSQIFLGIISPLMSINLYKGRLRITEGFKETEEIKYFIETNLTSIENCLHTNYERLTSQKVHIKYDNEFESDLTQMFFINNIDTHNYIEEARKNMKNKRKPTEILIYTDGYSFSAAGLFMQYLQKSGGAIIASYLGNPNHKEEIFDISQSPSALFTSGLLKIFSPDNYNNLINYNREDEDKDEWQIEFPGIQTFYGLEDYEIPLEYEVIKPDINSDIYENLDGETYLTFIRKSLEIFQKFQTDCNSENKNLVKVAAECDNQFENEYTHGGYLCGDDNKWSNICVPSYCDPGYFFNQTEKKCIKDLCSSIPTKSNDEGENSFYTKFAIFNILNVFLFFILFN